LIAIPSFAGIRNAYFICNKISKPLPGAEYQDAYAKRKERLPRLSICMRFSHHKARKSCMRQGAKRTKKCFEENVPPLRVKIDLANSKKQKRREKIDTTPFGRRRNVCLPVPLRTAGATQPPSPKRICRRGIK
jgi:hypothetical protein